MIYRTFISTIMATAVAITGLTAAPARADNDDIVKLLAGVAAVAIIGSAISNSRNDDDYAVSRQYNYNVGSRNNYRKGKRHTHHHGTHSRKHNNRGHNKHGYHNGHRRYNDPRGDNYKHGYKNNQHTRPLPNRVQRKVLPSSCIVQARNNSGSFYAFGTRCLNNSFRYAGSLPSRCATNALTSKAQRRQAVYNATCLSRHGYTSGRY